MPSEIEDIFLLSEAPFLDYKNAIGNSNLKRLFELVARNSNVIMMGHEIK